MKRLVCSVLICLALAVLCTLHVVVYSSTSQDRVELIPIQTDLATLAAAYEEIRQGDGGLPAAREENGRTYFVTSDRFASQKIEAVLTQAGFSPDAFQLLDYSWGCAVVRQSIKLPWIVGALLAVLWLIRFWASQIHGEAAAYRCSAGQMYLSEFLEMRSVQLMGKAIGLTVSIFLCLFLARWAVTTPLTLPWGFLPDGSLFDLGHYRSWFEQAFPQGLCSDYGQWLRSRLVHCYTFAVIELLLLLLLAALLPLHLKKLNGRKEFKDGETI